MNTPLALVPALSFGVIPGIVTKSGGRPCQQLMATAVGIGGLAASVALVLRPDIGIVVFGAGFASGLLWAVGTVLQYETFSLVGSGSAFSLQVGAQLVLSAIAGLTLFGEWATSVSRVVGLVALALVMAGVSLAGWQGRGVAAADHADHRRAVLLSLAASVAFVSYAMMPRLVGATGAAALVPQAVGIALGALCLSLVDRALQRRADASEALFGINVMPCVLAGVVWAVGDMAFVYSNQLNGIAVSFTFSQLAVAVSTVISIVVLHEAADVDKRRRLIAGAVLITVGASLVGVTKL
ncbi:GRP family sugar transporter [Olsenella massiliensis]|uniref:GRP family sugar transporter n=1 Tax=Olsenella massiliensis TaxID=1622075 RepID=UPI00071C396A|nr:GRP family sugar transporter [Olsenella massiliensis]